MGDRNFVQPSEMRDFQPLSDRFPLEKPNLGSMEQGENSAFQDAEAALIDQLSPVQLSPAQLRAVARWMRSLSHSYEHQAPPEVGQCFRAQASRLEQLARKITPDAGAVVGSIMSPTLAYLLTATGQYLRQPLNQPGAMEAPLEPCEEEEFREAYANPDFSVILGAERLARCFSVDP